MSAGDYTLVGAGTVTTSTSVAAPVFLTLTEVNGIGISPTALYSGNLVFTPSGGTYDLLNDPGTGVIWNGSLFIDVDAALAAIHIDGRATKIVYHMDNTLTAISEANSIAFIAKKDGIVRLEVNVPEPASMVLAFFGSLGVSLGHPPAQPLAVRSAIVDPPTKRPDWRSSFISRILRAISPLRSGGQRSILVRCNG